MNRVSGGLPMAYEADDPAGVPAPGYRPVGADVPHTSDTTAFKVTGFEPNRWLLWHQPLSMWSWRLTPLPGGRTRLELEGFPYAERGYTVGS